MSRKLIYKGVDIYGQVSINRCIHDMYAEGRSDTLTIRFNDPTGIWSKWQPVNGDVVSFEDGAARTGKMFVSSLRPENGLFTIRAMAMPLSGETVNSRSWEAVRFLQLGQEFAGRHGLEFVNHGCADQVYAYLSQARQTDFEFFYDRCLLEGYQMLIYDGKLIAYDEAAIESAAPAGTIKLGADGVFDYTDDTAHLYGSAAVESGNYSGSFAEPTGANAGRIYRPKQDIYVTSNAEATRYAKGLLRYANKAMKRGTVRDELLPHCAAGSIFTLTTSKAMAWNGTIYAQHVRHDYVQNETKIFFRRPLEGY